MIPSIGRIVHYKLSSYDAVSINGLRSEALSARASSPHLGTLVRTGNAVRSGQVYPMMIVRTWGELEGAAVNGQVFLDGDDSYWATSRAQGDGEGQWFEPPHV